MATSNQISIDIPQSVVDEVSKKLKECRDALAPYLQALTPEQARSLFKMGDKTVSTVQKVDDFVETNPEFVPGYMETAEFRKDSQVVKQLAPIHAVVEQISSDLNDTIMLAGSEALMNALLYYGSVREASAKGVASAKPIYEDLKPRFSKPLGKKVKG